MSEDVTTAAKTLFLHLTDRDYDGIQDYDDLWSDNSNCTVLTILRELCEHFSIDSAKLEEFIKMTRKCDYCGENTAPTENENGEHVCGECLKKFASEP